MTWFKVDDGFYSHAKVLSIPRADRAAAVGTWIICGTWAADKRTDGKVPAHMIEELGGSAAGADALVAVRLWKKTRAGYQFVNWAEFQPTRAEQTEKTEEERVRKADWRARKKAGGPAAAAPPPPDEPPPTPGSVPDSSADVPLGHIRTDADVPSIPSRPVPTRDSYGDSGLSSDVSERESYPQDRRPAPPPPSDRRELDLTAVQAAIERLCGRDCRPMLAARIAGIVISRSPTPVLSKTRYVVRAIETEPFVWQQFVDEHPDPEEALA